MTAKIYTLENSAGTRVELTDAGASIVKIVFNGQPVTVGLETAEDYLHNDDRYFGATVGRYANRIGKAAFELAGKQYTLDKNDGENCLHGGCSSWNSRIWDAEELEDGVKFSLHSPDGDQGMPGSADVSVKFSLGEDNALHIQYSAVADADTYFNLTNHAYFNLGGTHEDHFLRMPAESYVEVDEALIPTGKVLPVDEHMDFRSFKAIDSSYDNCYDLGELRCKAEPIADIWSWDSGIGMMVFSDMPAVQLYTGHKETFCLETEFYPDSPNWPDFPTCLFKAGVPFESETIYKFYQA